MKLTVKQARILADMTRTATAEKLGIAVSTYDNKENCRSKWTVDEAIKLAEVFNVSFDDLIFICHDRSKNETIDGEGETNEIVHQ